MKNVLITGAGRGIGLALTKEFSSQGYKVLATYREEKSARELLQFAQEAEVATVVADITQEGSLEALKARLADWGSVDILVNNAGVVGNTSAGLKDLDPHQMQKTFAVNTFGPLRMSQLALPFLKKGAKIAHITSLMGSITENGGGYYDYGMSKAALNMFNSCLAKEFPDFTCLVLHPGWVKTDMGGSQAPLTKEDSAQGLARVILNARPEQSGHFFDYTGKELPW